jgi:methionine aminotransferase
VASYAAISNENDVDFANDLWNMAWLQLFLLFYADGKDLKLIRFCFAKDNATLEEAAKRLPSKIGIEIYFIMRAYYLILLYLQ